MVNVSEAGLRLSILLLSRRPPVLLRHFLSRPLYRFLPVDAVEGVGLGQFHDLPEPLAEEGVAQHLLFIIPCHQLSSFSGLAFGLPPAPYTRSSC